MSAPSAGATRTVRLRAPVGDDDLAGLALGDVVFLDGVVYTAREGVYRRILDEAAPAPVDLRSVSNVNFHCSPAASREAAGDYRIGAVTATASFRFARWIADWLPLTGTRLVIGKGGMPEADYKRHFVPNGACYLTTVGYGTGALLGRGVRRVRDVYWLEELGIAQALWIFEVANFGPFLVESDGAGNSLFERSNRELDGRLEALYAGLKPPAMRRFGEATDRDDDLI